MQIHEKILELRSLLNMSREAFSERIDVPTNTLKSIELKGVIPKSDVLLKICKQFPEFTLWLTIGETEYLAGQYEPGLDKFGKTAFQIIDSVDARNMDQIIVNPKHIKEVIFLQSVGEGFELEYSAESKISVNASAQVLRKYNSGNKIKDRFVFGLAQEYGTAILLVLDSRDKREKCNLRAVLVKDNEFDLKEIFNIGSETNTFKTVKSWFISSGIREFDIGTVSFKTLQVLETDSDELKINDIYPQVDARAVDALIEWRKSFK